MWTISRKHSNTLARISGSLSLIPASITHIQLLGGGGYFGKGCRVDTEWDYIGDNDDEIKVAKEDKGRCLLWCRKVERAASTPCLSNIIHLVLSIKPSDPMDCNSHGTHVAGIVGADARNYSPPLSLLNHLLVLLRRQSSELTESCHAKEMEVRTI